MYMRLMLNVLVGCYALAGAMSPVAPIRTVIFLSIACWLVTMPYFIVPLLKGKVIDGMLTIIMPIITAWFTYKFPRLALLVLVVGLVLNFVKVLAKLTNLIRHLPHILSGMMLYGILLLPCVPRLSQFIDAQTTPIRSAICLAAGFMGTLLLLTLLRLLSSRELNRADTAAIMLGFFSFLAIEFATFLRTVLNLKKSAVSVDGGLAS